MKTVINKRLLSFILTAMMLVSGMCLENVKADSSFACTTKDVHNEILTSSKDTLPAQEICTDEMLGFQRIISREVQTRRNHERIAIRTGMILSSLEILPKSSLLTRAVILEAAENEPCSKAVIIAYIHHQDGAKG